MEPLSREAAAELELVSNTIRAELTKFERVQATELEELNIGTSAAALPVLILLG